MKTIFLSFTPEPFYEPMKIGLKRYEYRSRFCKEECIAYLYLSAPVKEVVAKIKFGSRIELKDWEEIFSDDKEAMNRLREFVDKEGKRYAIPILEFQEIEKITLQELKNKFPDFAPPRSYYILDNKPLLLEFLNQTTKTIGTKLTHDLSKMESWEVCIY